MLPVIEPRALYLALAEGEAERLDEMQGRPGREAGAPRVAGVPVDLGVDEDYVDHFAEIRGCGDAGRRLSPRANVVIRCHPERSRGNCTFRTHTGGAERRNADLEQRSRGKGRITLSGSDPGSDPGSEPASNGGHYRQSCFS